MTNHLSENDDELEAILEWLEKTHGQDYTVMRLMRLIRQRQSSYAVEVLNKLKDRSHMDDGFDYYNPNDWENAINEAIKREETGNE